VTHVPVHPGPLEAGTLSRRALIRGAVALGAGWAAGPLLRAQSPAPFVWEPLVDHIQINSDDPRKSAEFYQKVMGLNLLRVGPPNDPECCPDRDAFFGVGERLILAIRKLPGRNIDHWALMTKGFKQEEFTAALKQRGAEPAKHELPGYYIQDPDGVLCQIMGQPGPPGKKPAAPAPAGVNMKFEWAPLIDHMQINSQNVRKLTEYYQKVVGLDLLRVGPPNNRDCCPDESAFFGVGKRLILAIRKGGAPALDHYALLMTNFNKDAVTKELIARGVTPKEDASGFHVVDPDGVKIQIMGQPGPA
jgi:catechol 2,3-dioxygenase-like lactoylglutathione lyase family enzyme